MPQISKKKITTALAGAGVVAGATAAGSVNASADTVVSATESGAGSTVVTNDSNTPNQSIVNLLNSQIRNLQADSNGIIQIASTPKYITQSEVAKTQESIAQLSELLAQYNELKAQLDAQNANNQALNGMAGADNATNVTGGTIDQSVANMQDLVNQMQDMVTSNDKIIQENANHKGEDNVLNQKVIDANKAIAASSKNLNQYKDGIVGNLDEVNRKSQDSEKAGGIVVDNTETQKVNTVTTEAKVKPEKTHVNSISDVDKNLERILENINKQNQANVNQAAASSDYKANSLSNIDDLNNWLALQKLAAKKGEEDAHKASTSLDTMDSYKKETLAKLNEAKEILIAKKAPQKMIDQVNEAIDNVNKSSVATHDLPPVGPKDPIEFGDIGQKQNVQNGALNGTIANTKDIQAKELSDGINNGIKQVAESNKKAVAQITPKINENTKNVDRYLEAIKNGGTGSQIDEKFLNTMPIYTSNDTPAVRTFYRNYIEKAVAQTQEDVSHVQSQIKGGGRVKEVTGTPSMAQLSAAMYAENAGTMGDGFGSVMLPSTNINDLVSKVVGVNGSKIYANSKVDGGSTAVYNAMVNGMAGHAVNDYSKLAAMKDWKNQYLTPAGSNDPKHAENTLTVVTDSPTLGITIPNSFVYVDANGNIKTASTNVLVSATAYNGDDISTRLNATTPTESGTYGLFIYNFQINPYTGQLVSGVSYIAMQGEYHGDGAGFVDLGGGGESSRMLTTTSNNDKRMALGFGDIGMPVDQYAAKGVGLAQSIFVQVDPNNKDAQKYAKHAPLFVSDIDDGQELIAYTGPSAAKEPQIVTAVGQTEQKNVQNWSNPYRQPGTAFGITSHNNDNTLATVDKSTVLDAQSAAIFDISGNSQVGLNGVRVTMRKYVPDVPGDEGRYQAVDTAIFAPFGIVGAPSISLDQINATIDALKVNEPKAKAETKGSYHLTSELEYMYTGTYAPAVPNNVSGELTLPSFMGAKGTDVQMSSNTSMVVTQKEGSTNKTSSGNSLVIKALANRKKTASGNSLAIQQFASGKTASGNSLVVTSKPVAITSGSGNSLVVQNIAEAARSNNMTAKKLVQSQPVVTRNSDGTHNVSMSVYVDPSLETIAQMAMADWASTLANQGVHLDVTFTTDVNVLKHGVTLAILDSDDSNEIISSYQDPNQIDETMNGLGGLMTEVKYDILTPDGENDVFNKTGTITAGDTLKNSLYTIQLNTDGLEKQTFKNLLMGGKLPQNVLKHEIGHVFGLDHDDSDTLMNTSATDSGFTGVISDRMAEAAARDILNKYK